MNWRFALVGKKISEINSGLEIRCPQKHWSFGRSANGLFEMSRFFAEKLSVDFVMVISDEAISDEFRGASFGTTDYRSLVEQAVLKRLTGYHIGGTMQRILFRLGLTDACNEVTNDGKAFAWNAFGRKGQ